MNILSLSPDKSKFKDRLIQFANLKRFNGSTKLDAFLDKLIETKLDENTNVSNIIEVFLDIADKFIDYKGYEKMIGIIARNSLMQYKEEEKRFEILKKAFVESNSISTMAYIIEYLQGKRALTEEHIKELGSLLSSKIEKMGTDELLHTPFLPIVLRTWKNFGNQEILQDRIQEVLSNDEKLKLFLSKFLKNVSYPFPGKSKSISFRELDTKSLKEFINLNELKLRCGEILLNNPLDYELEKAIKMFISDFEFLKKIKTETDNPDE